METLKAMASNAAALWIKTSETENSLADACAMYGYDCGFQAGYKAAEELLTIVGKKTSQWISVKDRLPEEDVTVLAFINYSIDDAKLLRVVSGAYRGRLWLCGQDIYSERFITHWMPLPEPPKEDK